MAEVSRGSPQPEKEKTVLAVSHLGGEVSGPNDEGGKLPGGKSLGGGAEVRNPGIAGDAPGGKYTRNRSVRGLGASGVAEPLSPQENSPHHEDSRQERHSTDPAFESFTKSDAAASDASMTGGSPGKYSSGARTRSSERSSGKIVRDRVTVEELPTSAQPPAFPEPSYEVVFDSSQEIKQPNNSPSESESEQTPGERIRILRKRSGLSQKEVARRVGLSKTTIYEFENDKGGDSAHINTIREAIEGSIEYERSVAEANGELPPPPSGAELRELREQARLSQSDVAHGLDINQTTIYRLENDQLKGDHRERIESIRAYLEKQISDNSADLEVKRESSDEESTNSVHEGITLAEFQAQERSRRLIQTLDSDNSTVEITAQDRGTNSLSMKTQMGDEAVLQTVDQESERVPGDTSQRYRAVRKSPHLNMQQPGTLIGINTSSISNFEDGKNISAATKSDTGTEVSRASDMPTPRETRPDGENGREAEEMSTTLPQQRVATEENNDGVRDASDTGMDVREKKNLDAKGRTIEERKRLKAEINARVKKIQEAGEKERPQLENDLIQSIKPQVAQIIRSKTGGDLRSFRDDLVQETLISAHRALPTFKEGSFMDYVYRIAVNKVNDLLRYRGRRPEVLTEEFGEDSQLFRQLPEQKIVNIDEAKGLLGQLSPMERAVITLQYLYELSGAEAAKVVGISPRAVRDMQHRALKKLRKVVRNQT